MEDTLLQAREGLNQEVAVLLCQERVDPGVKESGRLQWLPTLSPLTPVGHLMGMDDPRSNRAEVEGWKELTCQRAKQGLQVPLQGISGPLTVRTRTEKNRQDDSM